MITIAPISNEEFSHFDYVYNHATLDDKTSRKMLSESRSVVLHWGVPAMGLHVNGELVSVNVTSHTKRPRRNAWGRYLNFYLAYTRPEDRLKGYASMLTDYIEKNAIQNGYNRMKSLAGSYAGVRLHMHMGHHFWGIGKGGALIVDTPLASGMEFPEGIPIEARNAGDKAGTSQLHRMDAEDIRVALLLPPFTADINDFALNCYSQKVRT